MKKILFISLSITTQIPHVQNSFIDIFKKTVLSTGKYHTLQQPQKADTKTPKEYKHFYISTFRHGSKYLTPIIILKKNGAVLPFESRIYIYYHWTEYENTGWIQNIKLSE